MPGRRMLRDMMSVNDIYSYAEPIIELLREEYGSYDADTLDEVQVEDGFAQRLQARGYEVRVESEPAAPGVSAAPVSTPPVSAPSVSAPETPIVPVTVVRTRRATSNTGGTARPRRATPAGDGPRPAPSAETSRGSAESARPPESSAETTGSQPDAAGAESARPAPRTRRTTRTRSSNNGEAAS
ncbi:MAG TPA: hypothetical protein VFZ66_28940 [Herpetosiphonaceae bacterium]